eukprot:XP_001700938.1 predicted protein [Chlamydomonas reinhardtii]
MAVKCCYHRGYVRGLCPGDEDSRAMRLFGLSLWRGSAPFPVTGEHSSQGAGALREVAAERSAVP